MVTDMGLAGAALDFIEGYRYAMSLWRQGNLKVRLRSYLNSSFDTTFAVAQGVVDGSFKRIGDESFAPTASASASTRAPPTPATSIW